MAKDRVGIIGPGRMGLAMLKHLKKHGFDVTVYDIDADRLAAAVDAGGTAAASPRNVGANSDYVIIGVGFEPEVYACLTGDDGALAGMAPGSAIAVCSTASVGGVQDLARICAEKDIGFLDAPIARGRWAADEGTLLALVGGTDEVVERSRPVFETFCSDIEHMGEVGHGQVAKMMNNYLLWVNGCALIEAGRLAESTGIDLPKTPQCADDEFGRFRRTPRLGPDDVYLGPEGHADDGKTDGRRKQGLPAGRAHKGTGQGRAHDQGDESTRLVR